MRPWKKCAAAWLVGLMTVLLAVAAPDKEEKPAKPASGGLIIVDARGKEQKLKAWEFVSGTRRLSWLAPAPEKKDPEKKEDGEDRPVGKEKPVRPRPAAPRGPEALVFRDENSTANRDVVGVLTLIPVAHLRAIEFDSEKETATVKVATGEKEDADATFVGTTRFTGVNKIAVEAEVDKGELGIAAVKYVGGVPRGIQAIRFSSPKPAPAPAGRAARVVVEYKKKSDEKVTDLGVLYRTAAGEKLSSVLLFKKTLKIDLAKLKKLATSGGKGSDWQVTLKDDTEETFTLLERGELDGQQVTLEGFIGRVPGGYKLFPTSTVLEVHFDEKGDEKGEDK